MTNRILPWTFAMLVCGSAHAHAHLVASEPAEGARLALAPMELVLDFSESAQLTALEIDGTEQGSQTGHSLPVVAAKRLRFRLPELAPGSHAVRWRVLSEDGHVMSGSLRFTVQPPHAPGSAAR